MNNISKHDKVLNSNKKNKKFRVEFLIPIFIIIGGLLFLINLKLKANPATLINGSVKYESLSAQNGQITIPTASFNDGNVKYYQFEVSGKNIYFFALKSADGVIRTAFDACDVCYRAKKGYSQESDFMICNNCGQRFPSNKINIEKGGCNPAPLNRRVVGKNLVINTDDINSGSKYF
ncbi:MAG: DUF2318 domain-containing protein [Spirochaetes bacterium]|nr:DUF2318 domain-containing protein [Spirochaetota bacterium]